MMTTTRWIVRLLVLSALLTARAEAQEQVRTGEEIAADMEATASTLHDQADRWAHAATLYQAAAELRAVGDPQAQKNLFLAANLYRETGDIGGAIDALEAAGARALAAGDPGLAHERFADAALVAQRAGLSREHQRLSYRTAEVAMAASLAREAAESDLVGAVPLPR